MKHRFEKFDRDFHEKLRQAFLDIAKRNPDRCAVIDAAGSRRPGRRPSGPMFRRRYGFDVWIQ